MMHADGLYYFCLEPSALDLGIHIPDIEKKKTMIRLWRSYNIARLPPNSHVQSSGVVVEPSYLHFLPPELLVRVCMFVVEGKRGLLKGPEFEQLHPNCSSNLVIGFSVDLAQCAREYLRFVAHIHERFIATEDQWVRDNWHRCLRLERYLQFIELVQKHKDIKLVPPEDVRIIWACHAMRPQLYSKWISVEGHQMYENDNVLYGAFVETLESDKVEKRKEVEKSRQLWNEQFGEPYDIDWDEKMMNARSNTSFGKKDANMDVVFKETLGFELDEINNDCNFLTKLRSYLGGRKLNMLHQDDQFLNAQVKSYERFLYLTLKHLDNSSISKYPQPAIDLVWHAHMLQPKAYAQDVVHFHESASSMRWFLSKELGGQLSASSTSAVVVLPHHPEPIQKTLHPSAQKIIKLRQWHRLWISEFGASIHAETIMREEDQLYPHHHHPSSSASLCLLSNDLLGRITENLEARDILLLSMANKALHSVFGKQDFWHTRFLRSFGSKLVNTTPTAPTKKLSITKPKSTPAPTTSASATTPTTSSNSQTSPNPPAAPVPVNWAFVYFQREAIQWALMDERLARAIERANEKVALAVAERERKAQWEREERERRAKDPYYYHCGACSNVAPEEEADDNYETASLTEPLSE
jgi:hypothetical protein